MNKLSPEIKQSMDQYYDHMAEFLDNYYDYNPQDKSNSIDELILERKSLDSLVRNVVKGEILDVGCGTGHWFEQYYSEMKKCILIDQSINMLKKCDQKISNYYLDSNMFELINSNYLKTKITRQFDWAVMGYFLSHFPPSDRRLILYKIKDELKTSGKLIVIDSISHSGLNELDKTGGVVIREIGSHAFKIYKTYTDKDKLIEELEEAGFNINKKLSYIGNYFVGIICEL